MPGRLRLLIYALFFTSGATALVYEVTWTRNLSLVFGASFQAISIVLASFMAGLALGGFCLGRLSKRLRRPLRCYALLEIGVALWAILIPPLLQLVDTLYSNLAVRIEGVNWLLNLGRVVMAFTVLLLPTTLMGGTLPVLTHCLVRRQGELASRLAGLYAINTVGAVAGTLAAGFVLLPALGVWHTQCVAVALNVAIGSCAALADRLLFRSEATAEQAAASTTSESAALPQEAVQSPVTSQAPDYLWALRLTFWGTAVSGCCALALEVMWTRGISISAGTTTYSFTIMLAAFLVGISLGSWVHAVFPLRKVHESAQFGVVLIGIGLSSAWVSQLIPRLPQLAVELNLRLYGGSVGIRPGTTLLLSFAVMLVPCVFMGMAFPLAGQARARLKESFGESVGDVVGLNTCGAIVGALAAGFVLIPLVGLHRGMLAASALNLAYGVLVLGVVLATASRVACPSHRRGHACQAGVRHGRAALGHDTRRPLIVLATGAGVALAATLPVLMGPWDAHVLGTFRNNVIDAYIGSQNRVDVRGQLGNVELLYYDEGRGSNVSVVEAGGRRALLVNGKSVASDSLTDMQHEFLLGHLPVLVHPDPRSAVVVGLGAGITLGAVAAHPNINDLVLVEIEPAVVGAARQFGDINDHVLDDPRLGVVFQDGRNYLLTTVQRFDVITADPIHPWAHGAAYLFTAEYYGIISRRLTDRGVMCQWLPLYELSAENLKSIVATFAGSFTHATLWQTAYDAILIGSNAPIEISLPDLSRRLAQPAVARQLTRIGLGDPLSFLAELTMDDEAVRRFAQGGIINTDDNLYLEFSSPRSIGSADLIDNIRLIDSYRVSPQTVVSDFSSLIDSPERVDQTLRAYRWAKTQTILATIDLVRAADTQALEPLRRAVERIGQVLEKVPRYGRARRLYCSALTELGVARAEKREFDQALGSLHQALDALPNDPEASYRLATTLCDMGRHGEAFGYFQGVLRQWPDQPKVHNDYGAALASVGRFAEAADHLLLAVRLRPANAEINHNLATTLTRLGRFDEAIRYYREVIRLAPQNVEAFNNLSLVLMATRRYEQAIRILRDGLAIDPGHVRMKGKLAWLLATAPQADLRNGAEALRLAEQVRRDTGDAVPQALDTHAAALAEVGRYEDAARTARQAIDLAARLHQVELADQIRDRLKVYESGSPFREAPG